MRILRIPCENHENHEKHKIILENLENYENIINPLLYKENNANPRIPFDIIENLKISYNFIKEL